MKLKALTFACCIAAALAACAASSADATVTSYTPVVKDGKAGGAWLVPKKGAVKRKPPMVLAGLAGENKGAARISKPCVLQVVVTGPDGKELYVHDATVDPCSWKPGPFKFTEKFELPAEADIEGARISFRLRYREGTQKNLRFAAKEAAKDGSLPLGLLPPRDKGDAKEVEKKDEEKWQSPIEIIGDELFVKKTEMSLRFIEEKSPEHYAIVTNYISIIKSSEKSGMAANADRPTFLVGPRIAKANIISTLGLKDYGSSIVHDAYHSKLYNDYRLKFGLPVPDNVWTGREAENACLDIQIDFLKKAGTHQRSLEAFAKMKNVDYFTIERTW